MPRSVPLSPLAQFFYSYINQDFDNFYPNAWVAVVAYVDEYPLERRRLARLELGELLRDNASETDLSNAVDRVGLGYHPPGDGLTYREWLEKVEEYLREHED